MTQEFKGTSELAMLTDALPVHARVSLVLFVAERALQYLHSSPDFGLARDALALVSDWHHGKPIDLDGLECQLEDEETSLSFAALRGKERSEGELRAWCVLGNAIDYVAYRAFRAANRTPWSSLSEIDESVLDHLDKDLRALEPSSMALMARAAAYLKQHPDVTLAQLQAQISKR